MHTYLNLPDSGQDNYSPENEKKKLFALSRYNFSIKIMVKY